MSISRRGFFLGGVSAIAMMCIPPEEADAGLIHRAVFAGKVQAGLANMSSSIDFPFIDILRMTGSTWQVISPSQDPYALLSQDGYPSSVAAGSWRAQVNGLLQNPSDGFSGQWVLDWTIASGAATLSLSTSTPGVTISQASASGTQIIYNITSGSLAAFSTILFAVAITACTGQLTKVRFYPLRHQALINSGQQWDPDFLSFYGVWGRVRFMDWLNTNGNPQAQWSQRTTATNFSQRGFNINAACYGGQASQTKNSFTSLNAIAGNPSSWTQGQMLQSYMVSVPTYVVATNISLGATTTVTATAHPFVNGDTVQFCPFNTGGGSGTLGASNQLSILAPTFMVANAAANTFDLSGVNSSTWNGGGAISVKVGYAFTFASGLLPAKPVCDMTGISFFSSVTAGFLNNPVTMIYDADFDRLMMTGAPNGSGVSAFQMGAGIETLVDLANTLGPSVQPWFCLPHMYDSAAVTSWATYIKNNLNPGIVFCVELSNEVWNLQATIGIASGYYQNKGALRWSKSAVNDTDVIYQYYGYRYRLAAVAIEAVFSGQMSRVNRIFSQRATDAPGSLVTDRMTCPNEGFIAGDYPINHADSMCFAQYYQSSRTTIPIDAQFVWDVVYSGDPTLIAAGLNYFDGRLRGDTSGQGSLLYWSGVTQPPFPNTSGQYNSWQGVAASFLSTTGAALKLTCYEGGFSCLSGAATPWTISNNPYTPPSTGVPVTLTQADVTSMMFAYWNSSQYASFLIDATNAFYASGGIFPSQYCVVNTTWVDQNPFSMIMPSRPTESNLAIPGVITSPAYAAWRGINGK